MFDGTECYETRRKNRVPSATFDFQHLQGIEKKKQRSRILQAYENKISYTPEDGNVGRNM
jgi:hypothetical protein